MTSALSNAATYMSGSLGKSSVSEPSSALLAFVDKLPLARRPILHFVSSFAQSLAAGTRVLDAGAGNSPYRELFAHCRYVTADWPQSEHAGGRTADIVASLDALPVADASFQAVLCTEVLEHVADPAAVTRELHRVLTPLGSLAVTVPFSWPLHEEPNDYLRFTPYGLRRLLEGSGFEVRTIRSRGGYFVALGMMAQSCATAIGAGHSGRDVLRRGIARALLWAGGGVAHLDRLDRRRTLTLGYTALAERRADSLTISSPL